MMFFAGAAIVVVVVILLYQRSLGEDDILLRLALGLQLGVAVGNLIDRIRLGAVIDFIDIGGSGYRWPAFNVADSAITIGVTLLAVSLIFLGGASDGREFEPDEGDGQ